MSDTSAIQVGKRAPAFSLPDQRGKTVRLQDYLGQWVVLYFYPKDDTPGCTVEACEFTEGAEQFAEIDAVVLGCSPDDAEAHQRFIKKHGLRLTLLSDPKHTVMQKYDAWGEKNMYGRTTLGVIRSTVLIDPEGKVAHHWRRVKAKGHADQVRKRLAELQSA